MTYTLEHLKIVYNAGAKKFPFVQTLELISLLGDEGIAGFLKSSVRGTQRSGSSTGKKTKTRYTRKIKVPGHRSTLSLTITGFLSTRGTTGVHVKDIAKAVKAPLSSVRVWFYTTGKKYLKSGEIKKVAPATYGYFKPRKVA
jgi:hypothetical protein